MEQTSFGPVLWAVVPLEEVGRLAGGVGREEQGGGQQMAALLGSLGQPESVEQKYARMLADPSLPPPARTKILSMQKRRRERLAKAAASPAPKAAASPAPAPDAHVQAAAGVARAELARRILALPDLELALPDLELALPDLELESHAGATVAEPSRTELLRRHPMLTPMTTGSLKAAVEAFCEEGGGLGQFVPTSRYGDKTADFWQSPKAEAKCGPVGLWNVSEVRNMSNLFQGCKNFNEDVSAWDVRRVENLAGMFASASSFNQPLGAWDISRAENVRSMFCYASSFNQPLVAWAVRPGAFFRHRHWERMFAFATAFDRAANAPWYT